MHKNELNKIVRQYLVVQKISSDEWQVQQQASDQLPPSGNPVVLATETTRERALEVIRENGCAAVECTKKNNYKIVFICPKEDYLRGLVTGSLCARQLLEISLKNPRGF